MDYKLLTIPAAYCLDLAFGDPILAWHPVRIIGKLIEGLETRLNSARDIGKKSNKVFSGAILVILVVGITIFFVAGILSLAKRIHPALFYILSVLFIYFALSVKDLALQANKVKQALMDKNIPEARNRLSMLVGRDTERLDEPEIIRASVETVAESIMDGIVAPLCYVFLGGPILIWAYKAVNTLDSMVGYRSERFIEFGKAAAWLDGLANFIPARITCLLIILSGWVARGKYARNAFKWGWRYFLRGSQVNSEATEAAMAGALGVRLGGVNFYHTIPVSKPLIGDDYERLEIKHIQESIRIAYVCSLLSILFGVFLLYLTGRR